LPARKEVTMHRWLYVLLGVILLASPVITYCQQLEDNVTEFDLDNGMKFIVYERHVAPVFFAAVVFNVGSINESDGITGISHLLEHMMFKGTKTVGTRSYAREKRYLDREDRIAEQIYNLRRKIGGWRLKIFDDFAHEIVANFPPDIKQQIGSDKVRELSALIDILKNRQQLPPEAEQQPEIIASDGVDYLDLYVAMKTKERELEETMTEHRNLIIKDELWDSYLQDGARMLNAFTANDLTAYIVYLPSNRLELWAMLESDRMKNAVFREFYSERNVVAEERRLGENDPDHVLYEALMAAAFQASPYRRPVIGWMSDIQSITRQELIAHHRRFYAPNNAIAILVGDLYPEEVKQVARRYFSRIPPQEQPKPIEIMEPEQRGERRITVEFDAEPQVLIAYHVPVAPHPDSYGIAVLSQILGSGRTSRLYKRIFEELELTSQAPSVSTEPGERLDNLLVIEAKPRHPHATEEVEAAIYAVIEELKQQPPTRREIERIRNQLDAEMVRRLGSNLGIAFSLAFSAAIRGDWREYLRDIERKKAVEPEDVSRLATRYLTPENRTVATLVKKETEGKQPEEIDLRALMQWIQQLPEDEQRQIFMQIQSMTDEERKIYAKQLMERMKAQTK